MLVVGVVLAVGTAFLAGRLTGPHQVSSRISDAGSAYASASARVRRWASGRAGRCRRVRHCRRMRNARKDAFDAGYVAGIDDVFSGYDGGWLTGVPYDHADARARCSSPTASHCVTRGPGRRPPRALPGSHAVCEQDS